MFQGDSGGPFVCATDFGERIYGILSHSEPLLESYPSSCYDEVCFDIFFERIPNTFENLIQVVF